MVKVISLLLVFHSHYNDTEAVKTCIDSSALTYRNVKQYPEATQVDGMLLMRIDSPIYFANVATIRDALM